MWITLGSVLFALGAGLFVYSAYDDHEGERGPTETQEQRDQLFHRLRIGDLRLKEGDLAGALEAHRESLDIATRGAAEDPGNATWQRDLAVIHFRLSYTLKEAGDLVQAREHGRTCVSIYRELAQADTRWQGELAQLESYLEELDEVSAPPNAEDEPRDPSGADPSGD